MKIKPQNIIKILLALEGCTLKCHHEGTIPDVLGVCSKVAYFCDDIFDSQLQKYDTSVE